MLNIKKSIIYITLTGLLLSCASKEDLNFIEDGESHETMIESFDLTKDKFQQFKVEKYSKPTKVASKKTGTTKKYKKIKSKKIKKKKVVAKAKKVITPPTDLKSQLPEDYPGKYLEYDKKSKRVWDKFKPHFFTNEKFVLSISYLGITAGHIKLETKPQVAVSGKKTFHFTAKMKSARFYEYIYTLDDTLETFIDSATFLPVKYTLRQRESGQKVDDLQLFDHKLKKTFFLYNRLKKGKVKKQEKEAYIPEYFQDSFSALYFVRGLPLKKGDVYEFPVMTRAKMWLLKMKVDNIEKIKIQGKYVDAIKIKAETHFPGVLKKKGDIIFWYSSDKLRRLLKFKAKVKIGAIEGELIEYSRGNERITSLDKKTKLKTQKTL
jgi:hypothetical protein